MTVKTPDKSRLLIVCLQGAALSAMSLRMSLECYGYTVDIVYVGSSDDFIDAVFFQSTQYTAIVIDGHGQDGKFIMPELASEVPLQFGVRDVLLTPSVCAAALESAQRKPTTAPVLIALVCTVATEQWQSVFAQSGTSHYIAYNGYPDGTLAHLYALNMLCALSYDKRRDVSSAHHFSRDIVRSMVGSDESSVPTLLSERDASCE